MFDNSVHEELRFVLTRNTYMGGRIVTVKIVSENGDRTLSKGAAVCSKEDTPDLEIGSRLAAGRALRDWGSSLVREGYKVSQVRCRRRTALINAIKRRMEKKDG